MNIQLPALPFIFPAKQTAGTQPSLIGIHRGVNDYELAGCWWKVAPLVTRSPPTNLFVRKRVNANDEAQHASRSRSQAVEKVTPVMSVHEEVSQEGDAC